MIDEQRVEHLRMIESIIDRMAGNSVRLKEWLLAVLSAILGFSVSSGNSDLVCFACAPSVFFWLLDALYLREERRFRWLYSKVVRDDDSVPLFSMSTEDCKEFKCSILASLFCSYSTALFYGMIIIGLVALAQTKLCFGEKNYKKIISVQHLTVDEITVRHMQQYDSE